MRKLRYNVRWYYPFNLATAGDVDFFSVSDYHAKKKAEKIGRELGLRIKNCERYLTQAGRVVQ